MSDDPILVALTRLEAGQTALRSDLTARMDRLEAGQNAMRTSFLEEIGDTRGALIGRLDRLQARIDLLQEECFVAFAQGETVRRVSDNTRAESHDLAEQVSGLVRQVRMLRTRIDQIEGSRALRPDRATGSSGQRRTTWAHSRGGLAGW